MIAALAFLVVGGILVYSAFQTPPDPRDVLSQVFGATQGSTVAQRPRRTDPRGSRRG